VRTIAITERKLVVVEGNDDKRFFEALLKHLELTNVQCIALGGRDEMRKTETWRALMATPGFSGLEAIAIIRDADESPQSAFQSLRDILGNVGLPQPAAPFQVQHSAPKVCILIMPDAHSQGELEDLCLRALTGKPVLECVEQFLQCVQQREGLLPRKLSKAKLYAYLSCREEAGRRIGEAAEAGDIPLDSQHFQQVIRAFHEVFAF
jgi:hypothetical protein